MKNKLIMGLLVASLFGSATLWGSDVPLGKTTCNGWKNFSTEAQKQARTTYVMDNAKNANFPPSLTRSDIEKYCSPMTHIGSTMDDVVDHIDGV